MIAATSRSVAAEKKTGCDVCVDPLAHLNQLFGMPFKHTRCR